MFTISKQFEFSASHQLTHLPPEHKCSRLHGHSYRVELVLQSEQLDKRGFVVDYAEMSVFKGFLDTHLDHRHLNDALDMYPTAEKLAMYLHGIACAIFPTIAPTRIVVRVSETEKTWATYEQ